VESWRDAVSLIGAGHDLHRTPLVESGPPALRPEDGPGPDDAAVEIVSFEAERVALQTRTRHPSLLVLAEAWYPGWSATVDGIETPCVPANAWMRAVAVPAGTHRVELRFRSRLLLPGALLSLLAAVGLIVLARGEGPRRSGSPAR
jgi:hypothetical protein